MRKKVLLFVWLIFFALAVVPLVNLTFGKASKKTGEALWSKSILYNLDFALPFVSHCFYLIGISISPKQAIIGKDNWLFLGDSFTKSITVGRRGVNQSISYDTIDAGNIGLATKAWEHWLKLRGVKLYRIMLAPEKNKIYPEYLPDWAQPGGNSEVDTLLANVGQGLYFDTRPALRAAKSEFLEPLYYKTDTHWNSLGAWVTFHAFTMDIARTEVGMNWLSVQQVRISKLKPFNGGNLANFLYLKGVLQDTEVEVDIVGKQSIDTEQYDFKTGHLVESGGNPKVGSPKSPLLVKSKNALNHKKVLWLRDSFGAAMSPYIVATFTETLQAYCETTDPTLFAQLVTTFKPDYVFVTVVDGAAYAGWFIQFPPNDVFTKANTYQVNDSYAYP